MSVPAPLEGLPRADIEAAFRRVRRPNWPTELDVALSDPIRKALINAQAKRQALKLTKTQGFDHKMAAAGDRDVD